jgi:hypothetical protein
MTKKPSVLITGTRFRVKKPVEFRVGRQMIARYLPGVDGQPFDYRVTDLNSAFVAEQIGAGNAFVIGYSSRARPGGTASTG